MDVRARNQQLLRNQQDIPLIDLSNTYTPHHFTVQDVTDEDFEAQVRRQEARLSNTNQPIRTQNPTHVTQTSQSGARINPFADSPSPSENLAETTISGNDLINREITNITQALELPNPYNETFRPLIAISLQEQWFIGNYASFIEDSLVFTKSYFILIANSSRFSREPTFWMRHCGAREEISIEECVNYLFEDYEDELSGMSKSWLLVCITTFLQISDNTLTKQLYWQLIIDPNLDSYDAFFINVKQLIMLTFIAAELIRPAEHDIKFELLTMLELIPHSAIILRYLTHSLSVNLRVAAISALSTVNFSAEHTFHALFRGSTDPDCRVRRAFCSNVSEFMVELEGSFFEVEGYSTEVNVQLTVMGNKVWFEEEEKRGVMEERLRDLWVHDQYLEVGEEAHTALKTLGFIR